MIGQIFGELTVIAKSDDTSKVICKCSCGNTVELKHAQIKSGNTKSCGCFRKRVTSERSKKNIQGKLFGNLTAKEYSHSDLKGARYYRCECSCGNSTTVKTCDLLSGNTKSCGCKKRGSATHGTIYGLYSQSGTLLYIGQTCSYELSQRLKKHIKYPSGRVKEWFFHTKQTPTIKPILTHIPIEYLDSLEKKLITDNCKDRPLLNTIYNCDSCNYKELFNVN